eukprot:4967179-Prymnesium_polylepis.3
MDAWIRRGHVVFGRRGDRRCVHAGVSATPGAECTRGCALSVVLLRHATAYSCTARDGPVL